MHLKRLFWPIASVLLLVLIYFNTQSVDFFQINFAFLFFSAFCFIMSTVFWAFEWAQIFGISLKEALLRNTKSLIGIFSPMNLGGDALRAHFSKRKTKALASSFVVKFFKFILMGILLIIGLSVISFELEFPIYFWTFICMILFTFLGAFIVLSFASNKVITFVNKFFRKNFVPQFRKELIIYFTHLNFKQMLKLIFCLLISTFFEVMAVYFSFYSLNIEISLLHAFVLSCVVNSLALITFTPQGIGFVEAGGFFILKFSIFGMANAAIGSFLIIWNIIRIWIPSLLGLILFWCDR